MLSIVGSCLVATELVEPSPPVSSSLQKMDGAEVVAIHRYEFLQYPVPKRGSRVCLYQRIDTNLEFSWLMMILLVDKYIASILAH